MAMRKPFMPPTSVASGDGQPGVGMPMVPQAGQTGARPPMPMGNAMAQAQPQPGAGAGAQPGQSPEPRLPANPGGPTAPGNIEQMLTAQMGAQGPSAGGTPSSSLPPWGDQGTRPAGGLPTRVPFGGGGFGASGGIPANGGGGGIGSSSPAMGAPGSGALGGGLVMQLMRMFGKA